MIRLEKKDYYKVVPLFKTIDHNTAVVYSVIEGNTPGEIFVDNIKEPKTVFMYPKDSFFYVAGDENNSKFNNEMYNMIFEDILGNSPEGELVLFSFTEGWISKLDTLFKDKGAIKIERKIFDFKEDEFNSIKVNKKESLSSQFILKEIDRKIAEKIGVTKSWHSIDDFLDKGIGQCIIKDNEIIASCYSIYVGMAEMEIDIFTEESHRGKGFGKIVATSFIESCISKGLKPSWSCWPFRKESYIMAKKLGFIEKESAKAHYWAQNM